MIWDTDFDFDSSKSKYVSKPSNVDQPVTEQPP